jgi:CheY-like chemotaxis protein
MGGTLEVKSVLGKGSTFTLNLPTKIIDNSKKELLNLEKAHKYKFAILNTSKEGEVFTRLIHKYLEDLNISNVIELSSYQDFGYDILFFVPNDEYNENVIEANIPAIAMLRSNQVKLADINHITSLYAPFAPTSLIQAIDDIALESIMRADTTNNELVQEDEELQYKGKILVAEDNKTNQMLIGLLLFDYGIEYTIANNGEEVVEIFKNQKFDLVLMDENMPKMNGLKAMKLIKEYEIENSLEKTPIVALTAAVLQTDVERFLGEGMDGFVAKPIDNKKLEIELNKYLQRI